MQPGIREQVQVKLECIWTRERKRASPQQDELYGTRSNRNFHLTPPLAVPSSLTTLLLLNPSSQHPSLPGCTLGLSDSHCRTGWLSLPRHIPLPWWGISSTQPPNALIWLQANIYQFRPMDYPGLSTLPGAPCPGARKGINNLLPNPLTALTVALCVCGGTHCAFTLRKPRRPLRRGHSRARG